MRTLLTALGVVVVLAVAGYAAAKITVGHRSESARDRLERSATRFVDCYERDRSYLRCRPGTSKLAVTYRRRSAFALSSTVDFGPTYTISRTATERLVRSCQPRGSECPSRNWRSDGP